MSPSWDSRRNPHNTAKQSTVGSASPIHRERSGDLTRSTQHGGEGMPAAAAAKGTGLLGQ